MSYIPWQSWSPIKKTIFQLIKRDFNPLQSSSHPETTLDVYNYKLKGKITGWCSWYAFGRDIDSDKIIDQAIKIKATNMDCEYILIDDGWCKWGDWTSIDKQKFPDHKHTIARLKNLGFKVGIWIAPFYADPDSKVFRENPDWFIKNKNGEFIRGMQMLPIDNLIGLGRYMIDLRKPEAREYVYNSIGSAVKTWQADLVKLDFLHAPYFYNDLASTEEAEAILTDLLTHIRKEYKQIYLMVSGCPFKPARLLVDSIRISKDNFAPWIYKFPLVCRIYSGKSVRRLEDSLKYYRSIGFDKFFDLDPDVIVTNEKYISPKDSDKLTDIVRSTNVVFYGDKL